jgi:aspartate/methionine/tyrosine aminotransferase
MEAWLTDAGGFHWIKPEAGAIIYVRYDHPVNSTTLVNRLREEKSVLIVPGDHFGMDGYLRLGFGEPPEYNRVGLDRLRDLLASISADPRAAGAGASAKAAASRA